MRRLLALSRRFARGVTCLLANRSLDSAAEEVRKSGLFDETYYLGQLTTGSAAPIDPILHYLEIGAALGLSPHPLFDSTWYARRYPEVSGAVWPPLLHYLREGESRGFRPNPLFDPCWYIDQHADVLIGGGRALAHYAREGTARHVAPGPLLDPAWYCARVPGGLPSAQNPLAHWLAHGVQVGLDPHPLFDGSWYLARHPWVASEGRDPVAHWVEEGAAAALSPHPLFDAVWYVDRHPEAASDPLRHWLEVGSSSGYAPHPLFDTSWYQQRYPRAAKPGVDPLRHYLEHGAQSGLLTHPLFDPDWYRSRHPELGDSPIASIVHCAATRDDPNPLFADYARFFLPDPAYPFLTNPPNPLGPFLKAASRGRKAPPPFVFRDERQPVASIVIPVWGQPVHSVACLRALAAARTETAYEVILVDDGSPDIDYREALGTAGGLRIFRNERNMGFVGACNRGAAEARGRYLVFLNNDTVVLDDWLDALLETFEAIPETGVAGAKLLFPSGRVAEAGAIVWRDGTCWNYGRRHARTSPEIEYAREADYISGAVLAIERNLFEAIGGFDSAFAPGYYEDTDLAYRVRAADRRVVYQPASEVIHFEGVSSAGEVGSGMKTHQAAHRHVFVQRWGRAIAGHAAPSAAVLDAEKDRGIRGQALVVDTATPTPGRDARSLRTLQLMRILRDLGFRVSFLPANGDAPDPWFTTLRGHGIRVLRLPPPAAETFVLHGDESFDLCVVCRPALAARLLPLVRERWPAALTLFDASDLLEPSALAALRDGTVPQDLAARTALKAAGHADATLLACDPDLWSISGANPNRLVAFPWVFPQPREVPDFAARRDLLLLTGPQGSPAVDALLWVKSEILPRIEADAPELRLWILAGPPLRPLLARNERLCALSDRASERPNFFQRFRLGVAPLRFGVGAAGRLHAALAAGVPCVVTSLAARGLAAPIRESLTLADDAEAFSNRILELYREEDAWRAASKTAASAVGTLFSFETARKRIRELLRQHGRA